MKCSLKVWAWQTCLPTALLKTRLGARLMQKDLRDRCSVFGRSDGSRSPSCSVSLTALRTELQYPWSRPRCGGPGRRSPQSRSAGGPPESGDTRPESWGHRREATSRDVGERSYSVVFPPCKVLLSGGYPLPRRALISIVTCFKRKEIKEKGGRRCRTTSSLQPGRSKSVVFVNNDKPNTLF